MKLNVVPHVHLNNTQLHDQFHENNLVQCLLKTSWLQNQPLNPLNSFFKLKFDTAICPLRTLVKIFFILWSVF